MENAAIDPDGTLAAGVWSAAPWAGRDVLDLGCGIDYWLPTYAERARSTTTSAGASSRNCSPGRRGLRPESPEDLATAWLRAHPGRRELTYGYVLFVLSKH